MALFETPTEPKVNTTVYSEFRGVDFTNDMTNVWKRRSPSALNMIPDLDGRPYKRTGWKIQVSKDDFITASGAVAEDFNITKCYYFELNGYDHIFVFSSLGLFAYREDNDGNSTLTHLTANASCSESFDRAFFFEGNGVSAFYVYGDFKVWKYYYDVDTELFVFEETEPTIPTIRITVSADGTSGTVYEPINLIGGKVSEEFQNNNYAESVYRVNLYSNVSQQQVTDVKVYVSRTTQFDTELTVLESSSSTPLSATNCKLYTGEDYAYIVFYQSETALVTGEDAIKVVYPKTKVITTNHDEASGTSETATAE